MRITVKKCFFFFFFFFFFVFENCQNKEEVSKQRSTLFIGAISTFFCLFRHLPHPLKKNSGQKSIVVVSFSLSLSLPFFFFFAKNSLIFVLFFCFVVLCIIDTHLRHIFFFCGRTHAKNARDFIYEFGLALGIKKEERRVVFAASRYRTKERERGC